MCVRGGHGHDYRPFLTDPFRGRSRTRNSPRPGNHWVRVSASSERLVCRDVLAHFDRGARGRRGGMGEKRGFVTHRRSGLLRRDEMDFAMSHLMDPAPFRGVCHAPSRVRDARDSTVPMAFFGFGKKQLPDVVQVGSHAHPTISFFFVFQI